LEPLHIKELAEDHAGQEPSLAVRRSCGVSADADLRAQATFTAGLFQIAA